MIVEQSIEIAAPPERIWPFFVEPPKVLAWYKTFQKFEYIGEAQGGVGTQLYIEEKAAGRLAKMTCEITDWVENKKIAFKVLSGAPLKLYEQSWALEPAGDGAMCHFTERIELPFGFVGRALARVMRGVSENTVRQILAKLKELAEA